MPRAKVPAGSSSKRSCSSVSIWRTENFSCCATSARDNRSPARACASSSPTPLPGSTPSVIVPALQRLELARGGVAPPQLVAGGRLRKAVAELVLDAHHEPQRFRRRLDDLVVLAHQLARLLEAALAVADQAQLQQRGRIVGVQLQRALEEILRVLDVVLAHRADAGCGIRPPWRLVQRVAHGLHEVLDRLVFLTGLAQKPAVVVVDVGIRSEEHT